MKPMCIYTDGACSNNGYSNECAGIGIFFGFNDERNVSERINGKQTNNVAELLALFRTGIIMKNELENKTLIHIYSDSQYAIKCVTTYGEKLERKKWKNGSKKIPNLELVQKAYTFFKEYSTVFFKYIKAHTTLKDHHSIGNQNADRLAQEAISKICKKSEKKKIEHEKEKQGHPEHIGENNNNLILEKIQKIEEKLDKILILLTV